MNSKKVYHERRREVTRFTIAQCAFLKYLLVIHGISQSRVAEVLGVSDGMASHILKGIRGTTKDFESCVQELTGGKIDLGIADIFADMVGFNPTENVFAVHSNNVSHNVPKINSPREKCHPGEGGK